MSKNFIPEKERDIIKQELNIQKWPLFAPSTCKDRSRTFTRIAIKENGNKAIRKVIIGKVNEDEVNILRIGDYKVCCTLIKLWEDAGRPIDVYIKFTLHQIAEILGLAWGKTTYKYIREALTRLRGIPIVWENSFYQKKTKTMDTITEYFTILEHLEIFDRKLYKTKHIYFAFSQFKIHSMITNNLLNNHSKPVYLDVILKFKKEISILLYGYIDLVMADKEHFERKTKELFSDLGLTEYKYSSERKRLLEPALKELEGVELTTGILSSLKLEKTVDETDYKVVFRKSKKKLKLEDKANKTQILIQNITEQKKLPDSKKNEEGTAHPLLSQLINLGVTEKVAKELVQNYKPEYIEDRVNDLVTKENIENKPAFLVKSIKEQWKVSPKIKNKRRQIEKENDDKLRVEYQNYLVPKVEECLRKMDEKIVKAEFKAFRKRYLKRCVPEASWKSFLKLEGSIERLERFFKIDKAKELNIIPFEDWKINKGNIQYK